MKFLRLISCFIVLGGIFAHAQSGPSSQFRFANVPPLLGSPAAVQLPELPDALRLFQSPVTDSSGGVIQYVVSPGTAPAAGEDIGSQPLSRCWTTIELSTSGSPSRLTDDVVFTANTNALSYCGHEQMTCDDGQVDFYDGRTLIATRGVNNCQATFDTSTLTAGKHHINATFVPLPHWHASHAKLLQEVDEWPTGTALTSAPNPSGYKEEVTFTATVVPDPYAPTTPTGKMKFFIGTRALRTVLLDENGVATFVTNNLPAGTNAITAKYEGDVYNGGSTSAILEQVVNP